MRVRIGFVCVAASCLVGSVRTTGVETRRSAAPERISPSLVTRMPFSFEENRGQTDESVRFVARARRRPVPRPGRVVLATA